jgi:hypothetical protein
LYFVGLSFRNASIALSSGIIKRSHVPEMGPKIQTDPRELAIKEEIFLNLY